MADRLTVYFTSDTHGYLYPTTFTDAQTRPVGMLGMRFPKDENTLIIDGGDTIQGSPLTYYCQTTGERLPVADVMNAMGYDYVTLGNHDFNHGRAYLAEYLSALHAQCLCANVEADLPILPACVRQLGNGLRVGLVGIVTPWVNRWEKPANLAGITVSDPLQAARAAIASLSCDVLVGIYHGGAERDLNTGRLLSDTDENIACRLCEQLPFDLLLTGHQHIAMASARWQDTHIVQPPANGAAYVRVTMDENGCFYSELLPPVIPDAVPTALRALRQRLDTWLDTPIGCLSRAIWPEEKLTMALCGTPIADFFNLVQRAAAQADVSCAALANDVRGFDREVTVRDVVASYVYANTLVVLSVTGDVLRRAMERCAEYFFVDADQSVRVDDGFLRPKEAHYNFDYFLGVDYTFDLRRPKGERVTRLERGGKPVQPQDSLTLCMCDYRATGSGGFECYLGCARVREIQTEVSELILNALRDHDIIPIPENEHYRVILPNGLVARR